VICADEVRFDYGDGPRGPAHWGDLNVNWTKCKTGKYQSPMMITPGIMVTDPRLGDLDAEYSSEPVAANISINEGYAVEVMVNPDSGLLKVNGVRYRPHQFHFHLGSEHKLPGHSFPMELHLVHTSEEDPTVTAVVAWLFVQGPDSPFLAQVHGTPNFAKNVELLELWLQPFCGFWWTDSVDVVGLAV
jgi:carbonic anhydrase